MKIVHQKFPLWTASKRWNGLYDIEIPMMKVGNPDSKVHGADMGPSGADSTQMGPMLAPWTLLSG